MNETVKLENYNLKAGEAEFDSHLEEIEIGSNLGARESTYRFAHQQLRVFLWVVPFIVSFFISIIPFLGPFVIGVLVYKLNESKLVGQAREIFIFSFLGILAYCLSFYFSGWSIKAFAVVTLLNISFYFGGFFWSIIFKKRKNVE